MSLLPTAHAGQSFGARRVDYFTVSGQVSASDANTGRVTDHDGIEHDVRLIEPSSAFAPGDTATILRIQSGPNRRSRPVAIVNHSRGVWMRASPDATAILARSGVTRTFNWWLAMIALVLVGIAAVWPTAHVFLTEVNGAMMADIPAWDVFALIGAQFSNLAGWRLETALPTGMADGLRGLGFVPMEQLTEITLFTGAALLGFIAFASRDWRLLWIPVLAGYTLLVGAVLGGAEPTLITIAAALLIFMGGGLINRIRDNGRFNSRVERLAEHVLRHPPQEEVRTSEIAAAAMVASAAAAATADNTEDAVDTASPAETVAPMEARATDAPVDEAVSDTAPALPGETGEVVADFSELPRPAEESASAETPDADAANSDTQDSDSASADAPMTGESQTASTEPVAADDDLASAANTAAASEDTSETVAPEASEVEAEATDTLAEETADDATAETVDPASEGEDDLPSMDEVAAAAALSETETASEEAAPVIDLEDERTLPVAPPPPMPEARSAETPAPDTPEPTVDAAPAQEAADARAAEGLAPLADDPMIDDANDPMTQSADTGDFAPGAPDIEIERNPAE